jgi:hypothetical protein
MKYPTSEAINSISVENASQATIRARPGKSQLDRGVKRALAGAAGSFANERTVPPPAL